VSEQVNDECFIRIPSKPFSGLELEIFGLFLDLVGTLHHC